MERNRIQGLASRVDHLLLELCEAGLYELGECKNPDGNKVYDEVAKAAKLLDDFVCGKDGCSHQIKAEVKRLKHELAKEKKREKRYG